MLPTMLELDPVVTVALALLGAIFVGSLIALVLVLYHKYCKKQDLISQAEANTNPDQTLVDSMEGGEMATGVELDDVTFMPQIDTLLQDEDWVDDATGLIPHCLPILKTCHQLTEKLVAMTMGNAGQLRSPESLTEIVNIAKKISPRVDDVVRSMYPPLDPRLLEARCSALVLSVTHLVIVTKHVCHLSGVMDWIDQSLADIEDHLVVLREASVNVEHAIRSTLNSVNRDTLLANGQITNLSHDNILPNGHLGTGSHDQSLPNGHIALVDRGDNSIERGSIQLHDHRGQHMMAITDSPSHTVNAPDIQQSTQQASVPTSNETSQV